MAGVAEAQGGGVTSGGSSEAGVPSSIPADSCGSRWPRQETLALIEIRSEMDPVFRDASLKAPLWEQVSRRMGELGFQRSAKKCREKFENVYKYHKRTKDGRASKSEGKKTYRFFDQLEALENNPILNVPLSAAVLPSSPTPVTVLPPPPPHPPFQPASYQQPSHLQSLMLSDSTTMSWSSSSSSSSSEEEDTRRQERGSSRSRKRRKKWKAYLEMVMRQVIEKQEQRQQRLLETLEQREMDRIAKEEAWRLQETARINREHDLLVRERSMAAAKDAAMIAFLQKISDNNTTFQPSNQPPVHPEQPAETSVSRKEEENGGGGVGGGDNSSASSSRWPKAEVEALINLRTSLDLKYQGGGPKGPFWEEVSAGMAKMGYKRSSKRCKEKWENINKYYKKVKETNKRRPEDSKTCPYFHKLEALYQHKTAARSNKSMAPLPQQQQWPQPLPLQQQRMYNHNGNSNPEVFGLHEDEEEEEDEDEDGYEMIGNQQFASPSPTTAH